MHKPGYRLSRVTESLQRELSHLILHELEDPRLKGVTLSTVKISADLSHARVYFTAIDESRPDRIERALNHASGYLRRRIAANLELRIAPALTFMYDSALRHAEHLTRLIDTAIDTDASFHQAGEEDEQSSA